VKYMLLIYGNEEAFSSVGAETFAEIARPVGTPDLPGPRERRGRR
jgi:hypothetical protein